jgi:hypothetical protein
MAVTWSTTAPDTTTVVSWSDYVASNGQWPYKSGSYSFGMQAYCRITRLTDNRLCVEVAIRIACGSGWGAGNTVSLAPTVANETNSYASYAYGSTSMHTAATFYAFLPASYSESTVVAGETWSGGKTETVTLTVPDLYKSVKLWKKVSGTWTLMNTLVSVS